MKKYIYNSLLVVFAMVLLVACDTEELTKPTACFAMYRIDALTQEEIETDTAYVGTPIIFKICGDAYFNAVWTGEPKSDTIATSSDYNEFMAAGYQNPAPPAAPKYKGLQAEKGELRYTYQTTIGVDTVYLISTNTLDGKILRDSSLIVISVLPIQ